MLKRLLFLSLLCLGVALLMGLMVENAAEAAPRRSGGFETPFLAPPSAKPQADAEAKGLPSDSSVAGAYSARQCPDRLWSVCLADKPFEQAQYHAFHLSDEAG